jgi:glutathione synthase/RimK-type ligase-like ATP-grasp enzyme
LAFKKCIKKSFYRFKATIKTIIKMSSYTFRQLKRKIGWAFKTNYFARKLIINYISKQNSKDFNKMVEYIDTADKILIDNCNLKLGIVKDADNLSFSIKTYWPKYERFAKNNNISYSFLNIHSDNWIKESENFDLIVWTPFSDPASLYEIRTKINYIEKCLKIRCHPSSSELWLYEDKIRQYYHFSAHSLPVIPTFISFDEKECLERLESFEYPLISKSNVGSSSICIRKILNKNEARRHILKAFSKGVYTGFPYFRQKDYVFFQKFIHDAVYDLRIILVGDKILGYYRMRPKNDFRASGAGLVVFDEIPLDAVLLALKVKDIFPSTMLAVDVLKSEKEEKFYLNEISINITVDMLGEFFLKDTPGYYVLKNGALEFHPGKFWLQELMLEELIKNPLPIKQ